MKNFALLICVGICMSFSITRGFAQESPLDLPQPGKMIYRSEGYNPTLLKGIRVFSDQPFRFDFIIHKGDSGLEGDALKKESEKIIKYFLTALTVPDEELWVNLSPYEKDRIIPNQFGFTEMGRDLLAQDYILKQLTASLINPEEQLGKSFWEKIYQKIYEKYGTTEVPVNTFNKVWIIPETAGVYVDGDRAFIVDTHLKVLHEEDYLALNTNADNPKFGTDRVDAEDMEELSELSSLMLKEIILPAIEEEINEGKSFTSLRQIYHAVILATWFKQNLRESLLGKVYVEKNKISGIDTQDKDIKEKIYQQYLVAFKKGVFNFIKEDYDLLSQQMIPRKYFSGGTTFVSTPIQPRAPEQVLTSLENLDQFALASVQLKGAVSSPIDINGVKSWIFQGSMGNIEADVYRSPKDTRLPAKHYEVIGLKNKVIMRLPNGQNLFIGDDHNHAFSFWWMMMKLGLVNKKNNRILHIDAHPDAELPKRYNPENNIFLSETDRFSEIDQYSLNILGIQGFIAPLVEAGFFSEWYWLYNLDSQMAVRMGPGGQFRYEQQANSETSLDKIEFDIIDIDIDVLNGFPEDEVEAQLDIFAELASRAKIVSIVTSPEFIDQLKAVEYAKMLVAKISEKAENRTSEERAASKDFSETVIKNIGDLDGQKLVAKDGQEFEMVLANVSKNEYGENTFYFQIIAPGETEPFPAPIGFKGIVAAEQPFIRGLDRRLLDVNAPEYGEKLLGLGLGEAFLRLLMNLNMEENLVIEAEIDNKPTLERIYQALNQGLIQTAEDFGLIFEETILGKSARAAGAQSIEFFYMGPRFFLGGLTEEGQAAIDMLLSDWAERQDHFPIGYRVSKATQIVSAPVEQVQDNLGGIDLNPQNINFQMNGIPLPLTVPLKIDSATMENLEQIDGFTPVIFQITPIINLPLILGMEQDILKEPQQSLDEVSFLSQ